MRRPPFFQTATTGGRGCALPPPGQWVVGPFSGSGVGFPKTLRTARRLGEP
ncbi:hypothetical protein [Nocardia sp. NPDC052112]|uniref:hypothetical protein n=1 Tax=Nocardia sp. NPDC052112 TaxID=3155646 RepID=UPI003416A845